MKRIAIAVAVVLAAFGGANAAQYPDCAGYLTAQNRKYGEVAAKFMTPDGASLVIVFYRHRIICEHVLDGVVKPKYRRQAERQVETGKFQYPKPSDFSIGVAQ